MSISKNIKTLRERYDLTQQELAEIAGVSNSAVSAWETGQKEPRMGAIEKMATHFKIKKSNIIEENGMDVTDLGKLDFTLFQGQGFTKDEMKQIIEYAEYIKSKRD